MRMILFCMAVVLVLLPVRSFAEPPKEYNVNIHQEKKDHLRDRFLEGFDEATAEKERLAEEKRIQEKLGPGYVVIVDKSGKTHIIKKDEK